MSGASPLQLGADIVCAIELNIFPPLKQQVKSIINLYALCHFTLPAHTITELYRYRWRVELFFKWIKQHLRIKAFFGTAENAVKTQIWTAISVYVLVALIKKRLKLPTELYTILQILSLTLFEKVPLYQLLTQTDYKTDHRDILNQLNLFD